MTERHEPPTDVDPRVPNVARMYDYALGGKDNFPADRAAMDQVFAGVPYGNRPALENRAFLGRAVRIIAEAGIRQFVDLGSGLPTQRNVHEVAQEVAPESTVVYVDYDPVAVVHSKVLLGGSSSAAAIQADMRDAEDILGRPELDDLVDLRKPVCVLMVAMLHVVPDADDPWGLVARYRDAIAAGSYLVISHITSEGQPVEYVDTIRKVFERAREPMVPRAAAEIRRFFDGFDILEPGLVPVPEWRPDEDLTEPATGLVIGGVGRKH